MKKEQTVHMLDSLIRMTRYRDSALIAKSLVITIHELQGANKVELYAVQGTEDPVVLNLLARIDSSGISSKLKSPAPELSEDVSQAIVRCIQKKEIIQLEISGGKELQVIFPILDSKGEILSILIEHCQENTPEQQQLTEAILRIYQNYASLLDESQRDRLTGLLNRETFISEINKIIKNPNKETSEELYPQSRRRIYSEEVYTYWLGLLDIDHFKQVNDVYGHLYGDEVLILLVRLMQTTFRKDDLLFRYGGEEFIIVLKTHSKEGAAGAFERFRKTIENYNFPQVGKVTVSIGYVQITGNDFPLTVVSRADKALYYAKEHGRNCLFNYEDLVDRGELENEDKIEEKNDVEFF